MANGQDLVYVENWNGTFDKTTVSNGQLRLIAQPPTFTRSSVASKSDGTQVAANTPRFEQGKFGNAIMIEEGTTNLAINPLLLDNNADNQPDSWTITNPPGGSHSLDYNKTWGGKPTWKLVQPVHSAFYGLYGTSISFDRTKDYVIRVLIACEGAATSGYRRPLWIHVLDNTGTKLADLGFADDPGGTHDFQWLGFKIPANSTPVGSTKIYFVQPSWRAGGIFWIAAIQVEQKPYATSFIDGTRAAETLTIPTAGVLNPQEGTVELTYIPFLDSSKIALAGTMQDWWWIFGAGSAKNSDELRLAYNNGAWHVRVGGSSDTTYTASFAAGNKISLTLAWKQGVGARFFINGVKVATFTPSNFNVGTIVSIGYSYLWNGYRCNGLIDDLRISNRARTDEEIAAAYASGQPLPVDEWTTYKLNFDNNLDFNVYGTYITNPIDISSVGRIKSTAIGWNGTNTRVSMSISKNNGVTWSSWLDVTNGGNLPNIVNNSSASGVQIKFMITLIKNSSINPNCSNFIVEIYTLTIEEAVHYQKIRNLYIKIDLLDKNDVKIGELNGLALDGSIDINSTQAIRRTCDVKFYLSDNLLPSSTSEIWLDKRFRLWIGLKDLLTDDIIYFNLGIFVIGDPQIDVTINQRTIEIKGYDKMCLLDGTIGGQLSNIVNIPLNTSITQAITSTMQQIAGENKLLIDSMKDSNNNDILTPYTIEVDVTKTIYDVINQLGSLYMYYEFFYDVNGYFVFRKRRDLYNDPIIWDFTTYDFRVQSSCQLSFTNVKNYITVYGATLSDGSQPSYTLSISDTLYPDFPYTIEKIGKRTLTISENNYFTTSQCQSRAEYEAWLHTNFNDKLTIYCAPIYSLDVNSLIYLDYPNDGVSGKYTISEINIPLKYDTTMSITAYKVYEQTNTFT